MARIVIVVLAVFFTFLSLATAVGQSTRIWAALPMRSFYPAGGNAAIDELERAYALLSDSGSFGLPLPTDNRVRDLAGYALREEPTSVSALRILGFHAAGTGDTDNARNTLLVAERLKKRDRLISLWLAQDSLVRNDMSGALHRFDQTLRSAGDSRGSILLLMTELLSDRRSVPLLAGMLRDNPPWADQFWYFVPRNHKGLINAAELRRRLANTDMVVSPENDARLVVALVEAGKLDQAAALYRALTGRRVASGPSSFSFREKAKLPPFDWNVTASGDIAARIDPRRSTLEVLVPPDGEGVVARRLVQLPPGTYRLTIAAAPRSEIAELSAELRCVSNDAGLPVSGVARNDQSWKGSVEVPAGCDWIWLGIVAGRSAGNGYSAIINQAEIAAAH